ncbi:MAG: dicarboxylate/amino acid:cation symporter [Holosporales bacterium]|nr:dicarboxylate/amino acid:cation symporter [Holosporales bacterium]
MKRFISNSLVQLLIVIVAAATCYTRLPQDVVRFFLTISVFLRETLVFVLPFLLFSFVAVALSAIPKEGMTFVFGLLALIFSSNLFNIMLSGCIGFCTLSGIQQQGHAIPTSSVSIAPLLEWHLPHLIGTMPSLIIGVIVGIANALHPNKYVSATIHFMRNSVMAFMKRCFIPLLPAFVGGFLLKLFSEGRMVDFVETNTWPCFVMCGALWLYLTLWLLSAASFDIKRAMEIFKTTFPAIVTAFSTMSSAAALPLSLEAARKNTQDKVLADAVMPLTLNFHMVGDTILVPIMAMMVLLVFHHPLPTVSAFFLFGVFFVLNKFAGGGVPSGTIIVTVPVMEKYLGFDDTMTAFIIALYGVIDPIATSGNVAANNFFVILFQRIRELFQRRTL